MWVLLLGRKTLTSYDVHLLSRAVVVMVKRSLLRCCFPSKNEGQAIRKAIARQVEAMSHVKQFTFFAQHLQELRGRNTEQVLHAARDSQKHITDIKWAPSGQSLAMGAADGKIYVYR